MNLLFNHIKYLLNNFNYHADFVFVPCGQPGHHRIFGVDPVLKPKRGQSVCEFQVLLYGFAVPDGYPGIVDEALAVYSHRQG